MDRETRRPFAGGSEVWAAAPAVSDWTRRRWSSPLVRSAVCAAALVLPGGCADFVEVRSPLELDETEVDPAEDGEMLSRSALQSLAEAFGNLTVYGAWFTQEAWVGDSFPTRNEFGLRDVGPANAEHSGENWAPLHRALAGAQSVVAALEGEGEGLDLARAQLVVGWSILLMAESFCQGTVPEGPREPGPPASTEELATLAVEELRKARERAAASGYTGEGLDLGHAATVGMARAYLLAGEMEDAAAWSGEVPTDFVFHLPHADDPGSRQRLGNRVWAFTDERPSLVVPPHLRERADQGDPRIEYEDTGRTAQDGELPFYRQEKVTGWADPAPLTSGLEARYLEVEARGDPDEIREFVNERRSYAGREPLEAGLSAEELVRALLEEKASDHWLEGKRMGDLRRHGESLPGLRAAGSEYYKPRLGRVGGQTCWPVPAAEVLNNPRWH